MTALAAALALVVVQSANAAACAWTGATSSAWAVSTNWSGCSGGGGAGPPASTDTVTIGATATAPVITTAITVAGISISGGSLTVGTGGSLTVNGNATVSAGTLNLGASGSTGAFAVTGTLGLSGTGTINQLGAPIKIGSQANLGAAGAFTMSGGTFNGGTGDINVGAASAANLNNPNSAATPFTISGGTFTTTSGTLYTNGDLNLEGATPANLNFNSGTLVFVTNTANTGGNTGTVVNATINLPGTNGTLAVNNLYIGPGANRLFTDGETITANGTLRLGSGIINQTTVPATGTIKALGNIEQYGASNGSGNGGSGTLLVAGTGAQTWSTPAATGGFTPATSAANGQTPKVIFNKPSGTMSTTGFLRFTGDLTVSSAITDTATNWQFNDASGNHTIDAPAGLTLEGATEIRGPNSIVLASGTTLTVGSSGSFNFQNGTLSGAGTLSVTNPATTALTKGGSPCSTTNCYSSATISRAVNSTGTYNFFVGDSSKQATLAITPTAASGTSTVTVKSVTGRPAGYANSAINSAYVDRTWKVTTSGAGTLTANGAFTWPSADVVGGAAFGNMQVAYTTDTGTGAAGTWAISPSPTRAANLTTTTSAPIKLATPSMNFLLGESSDAAAPTSTTTFPAALGFYNAVSGSQSWATASNAACGSPSLVCGTASDPSGVQGVTVSVLAPDGQYLNAAGGTFTGGTTPVFIAATGTTAWTLSVPQSSLTQEGTYTVGVKTTDNLGNASGSATTQTFTIDSTAPTQAVSVSSVTPAGTVFADTVGNVIYYRSVGSCAGQAGSQCSFKLTSTLTDANPAPGAIVTSNVAGDAAGISAYTGGTITGATNPYTSNALKWSDGATNTVQTIDVQGQDAAGNLSATKTFTLKADGAGPTGGALTVNGTSATGGGSTSYANGTFSIAATAFSADALSGVANTKLWRSTAATLVGDSCGTFGAPLDITGITSQSGLATGCYKYELIGTDNVGNQSKLTTTVKLDLGAPSNTLAITENPASADQAVSSGGTNLYYRPGGAGGSFRITSTASDAETGLVKVSFPDPGGNVGRTSPGAPGDVASPGPYVGDYSWTTGATATGLFTVNATDKASNVGAAQFRLVSDSTSPVFATSALTVNGTDAVAGATPSSSSDADGSFNITSVIPPTESQDSSSSGLSDWTLTRDETTLSGATCGTSWSSLATLSSKASPASLPIAQSLSVNKCYRYTLRGEDNVGNVDVVRTIVKAGADIDGPVVPLKLANGASRAFLVSTGTHTYRLYYSPAAAGSFTLATDGNATDATGIDSIVFRTISPGTGWSQSEATRPASGATSFSASSDLYSFGTTATADGVTFNVDSTDTVTPTPNQSHEVITVVKDTTAPTTGGTLVATGTTTSTGGYSTSGTFGITVTPYTEAQDASGSGATAAQNTLTEETGSLSNDVCTYTTSTAIPVANVSKSVATGCYRWTLTASDRVGNQATTRQIEVKVDTSAPSTPALGFSNGVTPDTDSFVDATGRRVYLRTLNGADGGSFTITASTSDADTGIRDVTFPALGGTFTGGGTATPPATLMGVYNWTTAATAVSSATVTAANRAGGTSTRTFDVVIDNAAPAGGAFTANGTAAAATPSGSYLTGTTLTINGRTDYSEPMDGSGSGLKSSVLTIETAPLAADACGTFTGSTPITGTTSQTVAGGNCYRLTLTGTDNVNNTTSISTIVKVDVTPPDAPALTLGNGGDNDSYVSGTRIYLRTTGAGPGDHAGSFTVSATTADSQTAIQKVNFPSLGGSTIGGGNVDDTTDPYSTTYTWSAASTAASVPNVTAYNRAGLWSTTPFDVAIDNTAPLNGALKANGVDAVPSGSTSWITSGTTLTITSRTDYTETQSATDSGLAGSTLTIQDATLSGNTCGSYSGTTTITGTTSQNVVSGKCYLLVLTGVDNAGNTVSISTTVKVDTSAPTGGSLTYHDGQTTLSNATLTFTAPSDTESGILTVDIQRAEAPFSGSCGTFTSFSSIATNQSSPYTDNGVAANKCYRYQLVTSNNASPALTTTTSSSQTFIRVNASVFALSAGAPSNAYLVSNNLYLGSTGGTFGLELNAAGQSGVTSATWQGKGSAAPFSSSPPTSSAASTAPYPSGTYTWTGAFGSGTITVTRNPGATVDTLNVALDSTAPTGTISYAGGVYTNASVTVNTSGVVDAGGSGVASITVQRAVADFDGTTCTNWSGFTSVSLTGGGVDNGVQEKHCYKYQAIATDRVGNTSAALPPNASQVAQIPDLTKPTFVSASTNAAGTLLTLVMSEPLKQSGITLQAGSFAITYNSGATITPTSVAFNGTSSIDLGLPAPGPNDRQAVKVTYTQPGATSQRIADLGAPTTNDADSFGPSAVTNTTTDTVAPTLVGAAVTADGTQVVLTFSEPLGTTPPPTSAFTVRVNGTIVAIGGVAISGSTVTLTLGQLVKAGQTVTVGYVGPTATNPIADNSSNANQAAGFSLRPVTNNSTLTDIPPPPAAPLAPPPGATPTLVAASPADGSTPASVPSISLTASATVSWSASMTRPDGSSVALPPAVGTTATWSVDATAPGTYTVSGTMVAQVTGTSGGFSTRFTIGGSTPPPPPPSGGGTPAPPVQATVPATQPGALSTTDGTVTMSWPANVFSDTIVLEIKPKAAAQIPTLPPSSIVLDVSAFVASTRAPVTRLDGAAELLVRNAPAGYHPVTSDDNGVTWRDIFPLTTVFSAQAAPELPLGMPDGYYRDDSGIHILTRHLSLFAITPPSAQTKLAMRIITATRTWTARSFVGVHLDLTAPARIQSWFVSGKTGKPVPGTIEKTPTLQPGASILKLRLPKLTPGQYKLQMRAESSGQTTARTARLQVLPREPRSVYLGRGRFGIVVVTGPQDRRLHRLQAMLGPQFSVRTAGGSVLYSAVDPWETGTVGVVVDLDTVSLATIAGLHTVFPELRIVGLANDTGSARIARRAGVTVVLAKPANVLAVRQSLRELVLRRP